MNTFEKRLWPFFLGGWALLSAHANSAEWDKSVEVITETVILSGYQSLSGSLDVLSSTVDEFCLQPNAETYQTARSAWQQSMLAWMEVSWVQFGPISSGTGRFDIQIWPIRKGITHKTIRSLLSQTELTSSDIKQAGVSIRGLTGSEYLLFSGSGGLLEYYQPSSSNPQYNISNRCLILSESVKNAGVTAKRLAKSWATEDVLTPYYQGMDLLDQTNPTGSAASILWNALLAEIEFIKLRKLEGPLNLHGSKAKPTYAESWRSLHSFANILHQVNVLKRIYKLGFSLAINASDDVLNQKVLKQFDAIQKELTSYTKPMKLMLKSEEGRVKVKDLHKQMNSLYVLLREDVTPLTGFALGFNANDGD